MKRDSLHLWTLYVAVAVAAVSALGAFSATHTVAGLVLAFTGIVSGALLAATS